MKTITKHLKRTKTLCENNRKQQLTSTLYWVKFVSYLLLDKAMIILYTLYFNMLYIISFLLEEKNSVNVFDALQGAAPGMQIVSNSGAPGSSSFVSIRGASTFSDEGVSPLYVVDGVVVDNIDDISANDIKQIDVMKDAASSAIYGARSANGVILITTKSGESGKPRVDVRYQHSFYTVARKLPQVNASKVV